MSCSSIARKLLYIVPAKAVGCRNLRSRGRDRVWGPGGHVGVHRSWGRGRHRHAWSSWYHRTWRGPPLYRVGPRVAVSVEVHAPTSKSRVVLFFRETWHAKIKRIVKVWNKKTNFEFGVKLIPFRTMKNQIVENRQDGGSGSGSKSRGSWSNRPNIIIIINSIFKQKSLIP